MNKENLLMKLVEMLLNSEGNESAQVDQKTNTIDSMLIGKKVIVRTYSAGAWFGTLKEKSGAEVILSDARRLWKFKAVDGICLSAVAQNGIDPENSRISKSNPVQWLTAIEIIPCSQTAIKTIEGAENAKP